MIPDGPLIPLPAQPAEVPWPTREWPEGDLTGGAEVDRLVDQMFSDEATFGTTYAVVVIQGGRLVRERYGGARPRWDQPGEPVEATTALPSWSMAKSMLHVVIGRLVADGELDPQAPAPVRAWSGSSDPRRSITIDHLLTMRDGLAWAEDYVDGETSDVIRMLFGDGAGDVAAYATARPVAHRPDTVFNYSSGSSNILALLVGDAVCGAGVTDPGDRRAATTALLSDRLFGPIGMASAIPHFDEAGTWVASSYVDATARDMARFGLLALRGGTWDSVEVVPRWWIDHGRTPRSIEPDTGLVYGAHWWVADDDLGTFWANGYEGQSITCVPGLDLVLVRLGRSPATASVPLREWRRSVIDAHRS